MTLLGETRLLTVGEVALHLRQSERTVRDKINSGDLPALKIGSGPRAPIRVDRDELEAWLHRTAGATADPDELPSREVRPSPLAEGER